jgi:ankyrin repeat protein
MLQLAFILVLTGVGCKGKRGTVSTRESKAMTPAIRLHLAARNGDVELVKSLITGGCDVDARDKDGDTPLGTAATFGQTQVAEFLISKGADVNARDPNGFGALDVAHSADVARLLIAAGAEVGPRALYVNAGWRDKDVVELLLAKGARIDPSAVRDNEMLLRFAVEHRLQDLAGKLLANGTNANVVDHGRTGMSLLAAAVNNGDKEMVMLLIAHGADVNRADDFYQRPLDYASYAYKDVAELLLAHGADVNAGGLLHDAAARGDKVIVELFLAHGADVNAGADKGETALDEAIARGHTDVAEILRKYGGTTGSRSP